MPPIRMCVNGHNICDNCRSKLDDCPTCNKRFLSTTNEALEVLAYEMQYPCKYKQFGCKEVFCRWSLGSHEADCRYGQLKCPVAKHPLFERCDWTGKYNEVKNHLMENHLEMCLDYGEVESRTLNEHGTSAWFHKFVFVYDEVFFRAFDVRNGMFHVAVQYIGPPDKASKYKYKVKFVNKNNTEGVTVMQLTRSFLEHVGENFNSGNSGKLPYDAVSRLKSRNGDLKFKLEIFRVDD